MIGTSRFNRIRTKLLLGVVPLMAIGLGTVIATQASYQLDMLKNAAAEASRDTAHLLAKQAGPALTQRSERLAEMLYYDLVHREGADDHDHLAAIALFTADGTRIKHTLSIEHINFPEDALSALARRSLATGETEESEVDNFRIIAAPVRSDPLSNEIVGTLAIGWDVAPQIAAARRAAIRQSIVALALAIALITILYCQLRRIVTRPLSRLTDQILAIRKQTDFEGRLAVQEFSADDEIGVLAREFNRMIGQVVQGRRDLLEQIAALKVTDSALKEAVTKAEGANRAKSQFLANMSHEIRTPMNGVIGMAEILSRTDLTTKQHELVETIGRSGVVLLDVINSILDFSRIEAGRLELSPSAVDLRGLVQDVAALLSGSASAKGVALTVAIGADLPARVHADGVRLRQVLVNLTSNAIKFTEKGFVWMRVTRSADRSGSMLTFEVEDTGIGIAPDAHRRIFTPFEQADNTITRRFGGTGLGLAISQHIVERMGGRIEVESEVGRGSLFQFTIPLAELDDAISVQPIGPDADRPTPRHVAITARILVAEDNPVNQLVTAGLLENLGCQVTLASDGAEAVAAFENAPFDLVFMDCQMPRMDGLGATRAIRKWEREARKHVRVPIIALTAHAFEEDRLSCIASGMDDYVSKPVTSAQLEAILRRWLEQMQPAASVDENVTRDIREAAATPVTDIVPADEAGVVAIGPLRTQLGPAVLKRVISIYLKTAPAEIVQLCQAVRGGDAASAHRKAHSLKSGSANLGALNLADMLKRIEMDARAASLADAESLLPAMESEFGKVRTALEAEIRIGG